MELPEWPQDREEGYRYRSQSYQERYTVVFNEVEDLVREQGLEVRCSNIDRGLILAHSGWTTDWPYACLAVRVSRRGNRTFVHLRTYSYDGSVDQRYTEKRRDLLEALDRRLLLIEDGSEPGGPQPPRRPVGSFEWKGGEKRPPYRLVEPSVDVPAWWLLVIGAFMLITTVPIYYELLPEVYEVTWFVLVLLPLPFLLAPILLAGREYRSSLAILKYGRFWTMLIYCFATLGLGMFLGIIAYWDYLLIREKMLWQRLYECVEEYQRRLEGPIPVAESV